MSSQLDINCQKICNDTGSYCMINSSLCQGCNLPCSSEDLTTTQNSYCDRSFCNNTVNFTMWAEYPSGVSILKDDTSIAYMRLMQTAICSKLSGGICIGKMLFRVTNPYTEDIAETKTIFYPSADSPIWTELISKIPKDIVNFKLYMMPDVEKYYWNQFAKNDLIMYNNNAYIKCQPSSSCPSTPTCSVDCASTYGSEYSCINGDCFKTVDNCGGCPEGQNCIVAHGGVNGKCVKSCSSGMGCCANDKSCCNQDQDCGGNTLFGSVVLCKMWNDLLDKLDPQQNFVRFQGFVFDSESAAWNKADLAQGVRDAMGIVYGNKFQFPIGLSVGYSLNGLLDLVTGISENGGKAIDANGNPYTPETIVDEVYPELYNMTADTCNFPSKGKMLVDSIINSPKNQSAISGTCNNSNGDTLPFVGMTDNNGWSPSSIYKYAWNSASPSDTLLQNDINSDFSTLLWGSDSLGTNIGWYSALKDTNNISRLQLGAKKIFPLLSVESADGEQINCLYPTGTSCGLPNAFGVWYTVNGASEFISFVQKLSSGMEVQGIPIPANNFGIFSFPLLPKQWMNTTIPSPITPSPITPSPIIPSPIIPSPITPSPIIPSPITPSPIIPSPITPSSITSSITLSSIFDSKWFYISLVGLAICFIYYKKIRKKH